MLCSNRVYKSTSLFSARHVSIAIEACPMFAETEQATEHRCPETMNPMLSFCNWVVVAFLTIINFTWVAIGYILNSSNSAQLANYYWGRSLLFITDTKLNIKGAENLYLKESTIIVSNHESLMDIPVLFSVFQTDIVFLAKKSLFSIPFLGWSMKLAGHIPLERENVKYAFTAIKQSLKLVKNTKKSLVVFPEGSRGHPNGNMQSFKKGAFLIAIRSKCVLQPISIQGSSSIMPKQQNRLIQNISKKQTVHIVVHPPMHFEEYKKYSTSELSDKMYTIIANGRNNSQETRQTTAKI